MELSKGDCMSGGLLEIGELLLANSQQRLETVSRNVANSSTAGFKRQVSFSNVLSGELATQADETKPAFTDFSQSALRATGQPFDLALTDSGFFRLRTDEGAIFYSRNGQFDRGADGLLRNIQGMILQAGAGGDLVVADPTAEILSDGVVLERGVPVARIGVFEPADIGQLTAVGGIAFTTEGEMTDVSTPSLKQGMIETANVEMATEMVTMMEALRGAEIGSRIVQTYDTLINSSISTFGKSS
jgi:flagellar basal-body rod protein FlgF